MAKWLLVDSSIATTVLLQNQSMIITGIETVSKNEISVYPNPAKEYVFVTAPDQAAFTGLTLVDRNGQVLSRADHLTKGIHRLDLNSLATGVYLIMVTIDGKHLTKRIVKE